VKGTPEDSAGYQKKIFTIQDTYASETLSHIEDVVFWRFLVLLCRFFATSQRRGKETGRRLRRGANLPSARKEVKGIAGGRAIML
jgi:hypothetical protein